MKSLVITFIILVFPFLVNAQVSKKDMTGKIGISLYGGGNIPIFGNYSSDLKTTDFLNTGSQFGIGVSYYFTKGLGIEGTIYGAYNYQKEKYRPEGKEPAIVNYSSNINAIYNFGHMLNKFVISPLIRIGMGSYNLKQFEDGLINGDITSETNNYDVNSLGFNTGVGAEFTPNRNFSMGVLLDYYMYFPKQEDKQEITKVERTQHSFLAPQIKISYYIPTR